MPRAALMSIHARVEGVQLDTWEDQALLQMWGPRFSAYVVAEHDRAIFTLGRLPEDARVARRDAQQLRGPDRTRSSTVVGCPTVKWDGPSARQPNAAPLRGPYRPRASCDGTAPGGRRSGRCRHRRRPCGRARLELARRYLPRVRTGTAGGVRHRGPESAPRAAGPPSTRSAESLPPVRTPIGDAWILASDDEKMVLTAATRGAGGLLPSGDTYCLVHGADRELLGPRCRPRARGALDFTGLAGAVLVPARSSGRGAATGQRHDRDLARLSRPRREAVEKEEPSYAAVARPHGRPSGSGEVRKVGGGRYWIRTSDLTDVNRVL